MTEDETRAYNRALRDVLRVIIGQYCNGHCDHEVTPDHKLSCPEGIRRAVLKLQKMEEPPERG